METEETQFKPGDLVRHKELGKSSKLLVLRVNKNKITVRHFGRERFQTIDMYPFELEAYAPPQSSITVSKGVKYRQ